MDGKLRQRIFGSNPGKAPGSDELTFETWRQLLPYIGVWLLWIYHSSMGLGYVRQLEGCQERRSEEARKSELHRTQAVPTNVPSVHNQQST